MCITLLHLTGLGLRIKSMRVRFADRDLDRMETDKGYAGRHSQAIVRSFRRAMAVIRAADTEQVFYGLAGMHFEKLRRRPGQYSMRLNLQMRLIIEFEGGNPKTIVVIGIEDYH
jgi:plasmid maintenance system killer protein